MVVLSHLHNYCLALDPQCVNQNLPIQPLCDDVCHQGRLISEAHHLIPRGSAGRATATPGSSSPPTPQTSPAQRSSYCEDTTLGTPEMPRLGDQEGCFSLHPHPTHAGCCTTHVALQLGGLVLISGLGWEC